MASPTIDTLLKTQRHLEGRRANFDNYWQVTKEIYWPDAADFNLNRTQGTDRAQNVFDATGVLALERFAAIFQSLTTPQNTVWQSLKASIEELNDVPEVKEYFSQLVKILFRARNSPKAKFYQQGDEDGKSLGCTGNACLRVMPAKDGRGIIYRSMHVGDVWVAVDDEGNADTIYHKRKLTALQARGMWGERAPEAAKKAIEKGDLMRESEYLHVVQPRDLASFDPERLDAKGRPYESWEISIEDRAPIKTENGEESDGYFEQPYIYSRFTTSSREDYGRGPSMWTLPGNLSLQSMKRSTIKQGEKAVIPPILTHAIQFKGDGRGTLNLRAGATNPGWLDANGNPRARPFDNGFKYDIGRELMEDERAVIRDAHFVTLFQILVDNPQMTATEALIRAREKGSLIGPPIARQQSERLGPMTVRELGILDRQGMLPPPPAVLLEAGDEFDIEYESEATVMQREAESNRVRVWLEDVALVQEVKQDPTVSMNVNGQEAVRYMHGARGIPPELLHSEDEVQEQVSAAAEMAQQQQQAEQLPQQAKAARDFQAAQAGPRAA